MSALPVSRPGAIVTFTGRIIEPLNPDPEQLAIEDIAHALANSCRFTGHVRSFYSVAQHSVVVSEIVSPEHALTGLMHDASEAYLSDISRPIKQQPVFGETYKAAELRLMVVISEHFGLIWPLPDEVHWADDVLLRSEQRDLMPDLLRVPGDDYLGSRIHPWGPAKAERRFLARFNDLSSANGNQETSCTST